MADETDALTRRAERTRNHLTELVDSLQNQITPSELLSQLAGRRGSNGGGPSLTAMLTAQVSRNPIACMLIAAGIGWLMMTERAEKKVSVRPPRADSGRRSAAGRQRPRKNIPA